MGAVKQALGEIVGGQVGGADVNPCQIGAFEAADLELRQVGVDEVQQVLIILPYILVHLVNPVAAFVVGGLQGDDTEGVDVTHLVDIDDAVDTAAPLVVLADDVGNLQTGEIEVLRRRVERHAVVGIDEPEGREVVARHDDLAVDLVADYLDVMLAADVGHTLQLFLRPHATAGVVRVAEQEDGRLLVGAFAFEVVEVDAVGVALGHQFILEYLAALVADGGEETVVGRRL